MGEVWKRSLKSKIQHFNNFHIIIIHSSIHFRLATAYQNIISNQIQQDPTMYRSNYQSKRPYEGRGGSGRQQSPSQPFHNSPQPTEVQVVTNQYKLLPISTADTSDYCQYEVVIKNGYYAKVKDETTGEESRVFRTRDIQSSDMEKVAKTGMPWRIMKKLVEEYKLEVAYDGNRKAYAPSAALGPEVKREYKVKVKKDCEEDDPDAPRYV
jgi:hypothetical protein